MKKKLLTFCRFYAVVVKTLGECSCENTHDFLARAIFIHYCNLKIPLYNFYSPHCRDFHNIQLGFLKFTYYLHTLLPVVS